MTTKDQYMAGMPKELFVYRAKDSGQIYLLEEKHKDLDHAVRYSLEQLEDPAEDEVQPLKERYALERVAEFIRQRETMHGISEVISIVRSDVNARAADLTITDLKAIISKLDEHRREANKFRERWEMACRDIAELEKEKQDERNR